MSKRPTRPHSPDNAPLLSETADLERGRARGTLTSSLDDAKHWDNVPPPAMARKGQGSRVFRSIMLVLIAILALLLLGVRRPDHHDIILFSVRKMLPVLLDHRCLQISASLGNKLCSSKARTEYVWHVR